MTPERFKIVKQKLKLRQPDLTVLMEGLTKPHNFSAILRSCDAVGVYRAHVVLPPSGPHLTRFAAMGAEKWVYVERHADYDTAQQVLRSQDFNIIATQVGGQAIDYRKLDLTGPCAIVLGTEKTGVSPAALEDADQFVTIPMQGMVESLNVSVACALILFEAQRQRLEAGLYAASRLPEDQFQHSLLEWLHPTIARYCRAHDLSYPCLDEDGEVNEAIKGSALNPFSTPTN
jgi:tRNA (guanosine-2'-O-)-methyltransferase